MDMGGATTQLTFQPEVVTLANSQFLLYDNDKISQSFSQSYPSFGQDLTQERYLNNVVTAGEVSGNNTNTHIPQLASEVAILNHSPHLLVRQS
jgi:hypothetical protein